MVFQVIPLIVSAAAATLSSVSLGAIATQFAVGVGLSLLGTALAGTQEARAKVKSGELPTPSSRPAKRSNYGSAFVPGTPIWRVKEQRLYGCLILNSRPSLLTSIELLIDKRVAVFGAGDPFDFAGSGGTVTNPPRLVGMFNFWIGRGEQTGPPADLLASAGGDGEIFEDTDAWRGRTVLWVICNSGGDRQRIQRWPRTPPDFEVRGSWSKVWDPRDGDQEHDDADTWEYTALQPLVTLDALMQNPIRPYRREQLVIETFEEAADIAAQSVTRMFPAGTEARYNATGQVIWDGELEELVEPLFTAGASRPVWIGGRLGITPGAWSTPIYTVTDVLSVPEYTHLAPGRDLPTSVQLSYVDRNGDQQMTPLPTYEVPGALIADGGEEKIQTGDLEYTLSAARGQRLQKIQARRARAQRRIRTVLPPDAFDVVAGSVVTVALPTPYAGMNGTYEVQSADPGLSLREDGGVAMRIAVELLEIAEADYDWNAALEEQDRESDPFEAEIPDIAIPGEITATTGPSVAQDTGGTPINRIRFTCGPSTSSSRTGYEWEFRVGSDDWESFGFIDRDAVLSGGNVRWYLPNVKAGTTYATRIRTVAQGNQVSDWRTLTGVVAGSAT